MLEGERNWAHSFSLKVEKKMHFKNLGRHSEDVYQYFLNKIGMSQKV